MTQAEKGIIPFIHQCTKIDQIYALSWETNIKCKPHNKLAVNVHSVALLNMLHDYLFYDFWNRKPLGILLQCWRETQLITELLVFYWKSQILMREMSQYFETTFCTFIHNEKHIVILYDYISKVALLSLIDIVLDFNWRAKKKKTFLHNCISFILWVLWTTATCNNFLFIHCYLINITVLLSNTYIF